MFKSYAKRMTSFLAINKEIDSNECDVYAYGFEVLLAFIFNSAMVLIVGILFGRLFQTIIFLLCYCPIRQFAGGYHADNYTKCSLTFLVIFLLTVLFEKNIDVSSYMVLLGVYTFISYVGIYVLSPVEHRNNPLSELEKKQYKKATRAISTLVLILIFITSISSNLLSYAFYASSSLFWIFVMLVLGIFKNNRRV